jgi:thioredoxin reductase/bacterioferritin-associated ferredoxin
VNGAAANEPDLLVIGAGPAGVGAAIAAAAQGLRVVLLDEADQAGGQVYRAPRPGLNKRHASVEQREGDAQRQALRGSGVTVRFGEIAWSVAGAFRVDTIGPEGPRHYDAPALVVATGAQERVVPFSGWTTPGVLGLAATTILLKSQGVLPGRRVLVAGCGPLLAAVGAGILDLGGEVAAVVDLASRGEWLSRVGALARRPGELRRGAAWLARLRRAGVLILHRATVASVSQDGAALRAMVAGVDAMGRRRAADEPRSFMVDAVAIGHGLVPGTDITRLMRAAHAYDAAGGFWHPVLDEDGRSSVPGLYVAGDAGGIAGARPAWWRGALAGLAAVRDMGRLSPASHARLSAPLRRKAERAARFGHAMGRLMAPRPGLVESVAPETIVCRCEDVTRGEIDAAVGAGATDLNQLKAWTRCGMGPCQGRMCADTASSLLLARGIARQDSGQFTGRTPLRPVPLDLLTGDYAYADIVLPPAAPL